jgi:hypothetical protein
MLDINVIEIFAGAFIGMVLGAAWYSPALFGNAWMKCIDKTPETLGSPSVPMIGSIIASLLTAFGVSLLFSALDVHDINAAACVGLILGLLIIFPALLSDNLFCGWGKQLLLIQAGYRALAVFLMSLAIYYV